MANTLDILKDLFVYVPDAKVESFKAAHVGASIATTDSYYFRVAFLGESGEISTHGKVYGASASGVAEIERALAGFLDGTSTVTAAIKVVQGAVDVLNGDATKAGSVAKAIKDAIEALDVTNNVSEASHGITVQVDETDGKVQKPVVTVTPGAVEKDNDSVVTGGAVYTAIEGAKTADKVTVTTNTTTEGAFKTYTIKQGDTSVGIIDIPKDLVVTSGEVVENPEGKDAGTYIKLTIANQTEAIYIPVTSLVDKYDATTVKLVNAIGKNGKAVYVVANSSVESALGTIATAVNGNKDSIDGILDKLDKMDHSFTTVEGSEYVEVTDAASADSNDHSYTVTAKTKTLASAVGLTKNEAGEWVAGGGTVTEDGLATAADVAKEIVDDEKVIATALNEIVSVLSWEEYE